MSEEKNIVELNISEPQVDNSNPVEEKNIQNAEVIRQEYIPTSEVCDTMETVAPVRMLYEMNRNLKDIDRKVRGIDHFVMTQLGYKDMIELCLAFSAEQIDAIAASIVQIQNGKAMIIGDFTGIGKGRICAGIMRYVKHTLKKKPIFITEKPNLYSDIYRDIIAIGLDAGVPQRIRTGEVEKTMEVSREVVVQQMKEDIESDDFELEGFDTELIFKKGQRDYTEMAIDAYREQNFPDQIVRVFKYEVNKNYEEDKQGKKMFSPFIINGTSSKTEIKDNDGNILYKGLPSNKTAEILASKSIGAEYDCVLATYSQFSSMKAVRKVEFAMELAKDNVIIMDESHNASGTSRRGSILQNIVDLTKAVVFASATYAKRPDNMPVYAVKSNIADAELNTEELINAISSGGVALQEILSSQLVAEGQMMRRERSYEGIEINYITLDETVEVKQPDFNLKNIHFAIADKFLSIIREIIDFVELEVRPLARDKREEYIKTECGAKLGSAILFGDKFQREEAREQCKADLYINSPYVGIFTIISQLFFSIKAEAVADWAIYRMKQGKKPIIALASTLESALDYAVKSSSGSKIDIDFSVLLNKRLEKALEYTVTDKNDETEKLIFDIEDLSPSGLLTYETIKESISNMMTGITISPIDLIRKRIADAGFTVEEVTGRNRIVELDKNETSGIVKSRTIPNATDVFSGFNNNIIDCLIINQAGATGSSAHAIKTNKVTQVNYENGIPVVPTSLENTEEVKQRVMIILQAEGDVNKEVQKRGRIYRTGQLFNPIYDYVISAIPSEKRLMMMLRKKLKSLDANTSSNQKQSSEILNVVDFLNEYGDEVVAKYLGDNISLNASLGNPVSFTSIISNDGSVEHIPNGSIKDLAYNVTGRVSLLNTDEQEAFYNDITKLYIAYEAKLVQEGKWNLEVDSMDLQATTLDKDVISVGNPNKPSVFGGASFLELCEINNIRKPFSKLHLSNLVSSILSIKDEKGNVKDVSVDEYIQSLHDEIDERAKSEYDTYKPQYEKSKKRQIDALAKDKRFNKIKNESKRAEALISEEERITHIWDEKISDVELVFEKAKKFKEVVSFFVPKTAVSYFHKTQHKYFDGLVIGVKMSSATYLNSGDFSLRIAYPSALRYMEIPFYSMDDISALIRSTDNSLGNSKKVVLGKQLFADWDETTKSSASDRVKRFIVTGNILKAYGIPELANRQNKLISYSTSDKKVRKGILLSDNFEPNDLRIKIPVEAAINIAEKSIASNDYLYFGDESLIYLVPRDSHYLIRRDATRKKNYYIDKNNALMEHLSSSWFKASDYYENDIRGNDNLRKVIEILYSLGFAMNMSFKDFKVIAKDYDTNDRQISEYANDELLRRYNENLDKYEAEQDKTFHEASDAVIKKMGEMEKELYELRKEKENNKALRFLVDTLSFAKKQKAREVTTMASGGELTLGQLQEDESLKLITDETEVKEILYHFDSRFSDVDEMTTEPIYKGIGGLFVSFDADGNITRVLAYEGNDTAIYKQAFEVHPKNEYFK